MSIVKPLVRRVLSRIAPGLAATAMAVRARRHSQRMVEEWGLRDLNSRLVEKLGDQVVAGPFAGLRLSPMARKEHIGPCLLGTYEAELTGWWDRLLRQDFSQIVDVGAKFGYYAVGLARRYPEAEVVAFDIDPWARGATREMAVINRTPNVSVQGACTPAWLDRDLKANALVISDCEGYEHALFSAATAPNLDNAFILVETHEEFSPGVTDALLARFGRTHRAERVASSSEPHPASVPLDFLSPAEALSAAREVRFDQEWYLFVPASAADRDLV